MNRDIYFTTNLFHATKIENTQKFCFDNFQAKLGLTVGVLTGIGNQHELADADVIVVDVNECVDMILPPISKQGKHYQRIRQNSSKKHYKKSTAF